jgi:WD40 repeat protein
MPGDVDAGRAPGPGGDSGVRRLFVGCIGTAALGSYWKSSEWHQATGCARMTEPDAGPRSPHLDGYRCMATRPERFVTRRALDELVGVLCGAGAWPGARAGVGTVGVLCGASGAGKTALARALCFDERVRRAYPEGVVWTTMGPGLGEAERVHRVLGLIDHWPGSEMPAELDLQAVGVRLRGDCARKLVVVDDVRHADDLTPFLGLADGTGVLATTREPSLVPHGCRLIELEAMVEGEALGLLCHGVEIEPGAAAGLAERLGRWPLLLALVNGWLRREVHGRGRDAGAAVAEVTRALEGRAGTPGAGQSSAGQTRVGSLEEVLDAVLAPEEQAYGRGLAVFPEHGEIPVSLLGRLWGLPEAGARAICERLLDQGVVQHLEPSLGLHPGPHVGPHVGPQSGPHVGPHVGAITVPAAIRQCVLADEGSARRTHAELLQKLAPASGRWSDLGADERYAWRYLFYHLHQAGKEQALPGLLLDGEWLAGKVCHAGVDLLLADFEYVSGIGLRSPAVALVEEAIRKISQALRRGPRQLPGLLYGRLLALKPADLQVHTELGRLIEQLCSFERWSWLRVRRTSSPLSSKSRPRTLSGHGDVVNTVAVASDGSHAVSGADDGTIIVWDLVQGVEVAALKGTDRAVMALAVTPDGKRVVSGSGDGGIEVWDLQSRRSLARIVGGGGAIRALTVTPDGQRAVSGSEQGMIEIWDLGSSKKLGTLEGHADAVMALAVTPDGKRLVSGSADGTLKIWDLEHHGELATLAGHDAWITALAVTVDGRRVVSGSEDRTLKVWDLDRGVELARLGEHAEAVWALAVTPDGLRAISGSEDRTLKVWDLATGSELSTLRGHSAWVTALAVTPDGQRVVSGSHDQTLMVWDLHDRRKAPGARAGADRDTAWELMMNGERMVALGTVGSTWVSCDRGERGRISEKLSSGAWLWAMAVTADSRRVVLAAGDGTIEVWELGASGKRTAIAGPGDEVTVFALTPDGKRALLGTDDGTIRIRDLESGATVGTLLGHVYGVTALVVSASGRHALSGAKTGGVRLWDLDGNTMLARLLGHNEEIARLAISADGMRAVSGSWDLTLRVWDLEKELGASPILFHQHGARSLLMTADGTRAVLAPLHDRLEICDLVTGTTRTDGKDLGGRIVALALTADGKRVIVGGHGGLRVRDLDSDTWLVLPAEHEGLPLCVAVGADGTRAVIGTATGALQIWNLQSGALEAKLMLRAAVYLCAMAPDDRTVIAASRDGRVHVFDLVEPGTARTLERSAG